MVKRAPFLPSLYSSSCSFSCAFFLPASCLFLFLVLLAVSLISFFSFFTLWIGKGGGHAKLLDHLGRQRGRRARSVAFSHNLPIGPRAHGSFICILRFFEVKLTRRLPFPTTSPRTRSLSLFYLFLSPAPRLRGSSHFVPAGFWAGPRGTAHRPRKPTTRLSSLRNIEKRGN